MGLEVLRDLEALALEDLSSLANGECANTSEVFDNTTKAVAKMFGASVCTIRMLDEQNQLRLKSAEGLLKNMVYRGTIGLNEDCMGLAIKRNEKLAYRNLEGLETTLYNDSIISSSESRHVFFQPVKLSGNPAGVITVCTSEDISEDDIKMLSSVSCMLSSVLEKTELQKNIKRLYFSAIKTLVKTIEAKDIYTKGHSMRVSKYASTIAKKLGFSNSEIEEAEITGILHDIGKIGVNDLILTKPDGLSEVELQVIKQHPYLGSKILEPIGFSENIINGTLLHHKRFDLKGYPVDVDIKELPMMPRIIGAADAFDAMTSIRPYKKPIHKSEAINEMKKHVGTQFCPHIIAVMEQLQAENML